MTSTSRAGRTVLFALLLAGAWQFGDAAALAQSTGSTPVVKMQSVGTSYADLTGRWWEWALSIPKAQNPLLDDNGKDCMRGQTGAVWFLAGLTVPGSVTRACTVPAGKSIFFPIYTWVNLAPWPEETTLDLRKTIEDLVEMATVLRCTIDGVPVKNLRTYRVQSPVFATFTPPDDIIVGGTTKQYWDPVVADGFWLLLEPLAPGPHRIVFHNEVAWPDNTTSVQDVTYDLTIR